MAVKLYWAPRTRAFRILRLLEEPVFTDYLARCQARPAYARAQSIDAAA